MGPGRAWALGARRAGAGLATCSGTGRSEGGAAGGSGVAAPGSKVCSAQVQLGVLGSPALRLLLSAGFGARVARLWSAGTTAPWSSGSGRRLPRSSGHESFLNRNSVSSSSSEPEPHIAQPCPPLPAASKSWGVSTAVVAPEGISFSSASAPKVLPSSGQTSSTESKVL